MAYIDVDDGSKAIFDTIMMRDANKVNHLNGDRNEISSDSNL
jgi:hypothetical protein